jgi:hypothetical protein
LSEWIRLLFDGEKGLLRKNDAASEPLLPAWLRLAHHSSKRSQFQTFQWFDGLTMSGFILNRFAPFKALRRFKVQEFKETLAVQVVPDGGVKKAALSSRYKRCRARTL